MDGLKNLLPFLTREFLKFGTSSKIEIRLKSQANQAVTLKVQLLTKEGTTQYNHVTLSTGAVNTTTFGISDIPILISVVDSGGVLNQGDCYASLDLLINGSVVFELCSGMIYSTKAISYPATSGIDAFPGHGRIREVAGINDAIENAPTLMVPTGRVWKLLATSFMYTADATLGTRRALVSIQLPTGVVIEAGANSTFTATQSRQISAAIFGAVQVASPGSVDIIALPAELYLPATTQIFATAENADDSDTITVFYGLVEEFFAVP